MNELLTNKSPLINQLSYLISEETKRLSPILFSDIINLILERGDEFSIIPKFLNSHNLYGDYREVINLLKAINDPFLNIALIKHYDSNINQPTKFRSLLESSIEAMVSDRIWNQYIAYKTLTNDSNMNLLGHLIKNNQENLSIMEINIYE